MAVCLFLLIFRITFLGRAFGYGRTLSGENSTGSVTEELVLAACGSCMVCVAGVSVTDLFSAGFGLAVTDDGK